MVETVRLLRSDSRADPLAQDNLSISSINQFKPVES